MMRRVCGFHSCAEALRVRAHAIESVYLKSEKDMRARELARTAKAAGAKVKVIGHRLNQWSEGHQGIGMELSEGPEFRESVYREVKGRVCLVALDGVEDPQNLGNVLRTAWLLGVKGLIVRSSKGVGVTATVSKVASGGAEHVPVSCVSHIGTELKSWKGSGFWVLGLDQEANQSLWEGTLPEKVIWVAGSEASGLRKSTLNVCDGLYSIPQTCGLASLNVSTSLAIAMAEVCRQSRR